ncbi:hypothetical protein D554_3194 [Bordetella holmesii 30539]|uniref:N-acetyltransferase YedL n=1 Tax=Bordetella holmesii 1058 TaxID=1247648 RepID=A0ABN0RY23_9BORD|nr:hypothetical protein D560_3293 [Bordetella holmesii ATCC 51541]AIT27905.1 hypothetical protein D558_3263 [Bordetella holmesii 44057]EWM40683.1 hypothetical protein D555_3326 [Bordetella holmesii 35009]EWM42735.1 hypothetical protein D556_3261 [Bordetella holmesii 41130]EWM44580.1 hypothetical protein D557_2567 [Bordetella holmesii 70147]EXF87919.1 hypothetical protein D554_3194 [Bordetella holmesii 30539]EXX93919.1 hypothetical protein D559_1326 [Bordetella holmesii 1058]
MLAAQLCGLGTCIGFLEHADDLLFRKSFLHCHSFGNGLYIDFVLITGSRSRARSNHLNRRGKRNQSENNAWKVYAG